MAVETQQGQREEAELEQGGRLTRARLNRYKIAERCGEIPGGKAFFVIVPALDKKLFSVDPNADFLIANPGQPRKIFDPEQMDELKSTITEMGQGQAINVAATVFKDNPDEIILFLIDGERRTRTIRGLGLPSMDVVVKPIKSYEQLLYQSGVCNISRADHNPMELAHFYEQLLGYAHQRSEPRALEAVAKRLGKGVPYLRTYLAFLELPPEMQDMLAKGDMTMSDAETFLKEKKRHGDKLDLVRAAEVASGRKGPVSFRVKSAIQEVLRESGHAVDAERSAVQDAVVKLSSDLMGVQHAAAVILGADESLVIEHLFERGEDKRPPDVIRDRIRTVQAQLGGLFDIIVKAVDPPALEATPGKPKYSTFISKKQKDFGNDVRFKMAQVLAQAADEHGKFLTGGELIKLLEPLGIDAKDFSGNIRLLGPEIQKIGLQLQQCILRRKGPDGKYAKKPAWRLAWPEGESAAGEGLDAANESGGSGQETDESSHGGIQIKNLDIAVEASTSEHGLQAAARKIAANIKTVDGRAYIREKTTFGQRVGVKIEIDRRGDNKVYIVRSNVRGFAKNFGLSERVFRQFIAEELGVEKSTFKVEIQDL